MQCKICKGEVVHFFDNYMDADTYHCKACAFMFKDHNAIISTEKELKVYEQHNNSEENLGYVAMFQEFIDKTFAPYEENITEVLEFGSGPTPVLASLLKKRDLEVDIYDKFYAPEKVYEGKKYDLITSTEVIEHIAEVEELFVFFAEHLKHNGYLALMTQFHTNDAEHYLKWWYRRDPTHICFYHPHTFEVLAEKFGFKLLFCDDKKNVLLQKDSYL